MRYLALFLVGCVLTTPTYASDATHDGIHDFDFALGTFHTHIRRLESPFTGSTKWLVYDGTKTDAAILGGAGSVEQIEADGAGHLEFLTLRLWSAQAHQWSLNFSNSQSGQMGAPSIGEFANGIGTFLGQDTYNGRTIQVRQLWSEITPTSYHFEQAFSDNYGKTWETNFTADLARIKG
jgi:hypothetical protein